MKRRKKSLTGPKTIALMFILFVSMLGASYLVWAKIDGISGRSTTGCAPCHSTSASSSVSVSITGPETVSVGETNTYSVTVSGGPLTANGLDVSVTNGTLVVTDFTNTKLLNEEITQTAAGTALTSWSFNWTAPSTTGTVTMYVAGFSGDGDGKKNAADLWNLASLVITVTAPVHDVAITSVAPSTNNVLVGELVSINVTVKNEGGFSETFNVTVYYDNTVIGQPQTVTSLTAGATTTRSFSWNTTGVPDDTYTLKAIAETVSGETDTTDNTRVDGDVTVTSVPVRNIAITNVKASPTEVVVGDPVTINVTAKNEGNTAETFNVSAYYDSFLIDTQTNVTLSAGVNTTLTFTWNTTDVDLGTYTISANATVVPDETNTTDNTRIDGTVKISPTTINCTVSPTTITLGENVTVSGSIAPPHNATVTLTYTRPDDTTVTRTVSSNSSGAYNDTYTPDQNGTWTVKASWPGDVDHPGGATSELQLFTVELIDTSSPTIFINSPAEGAITTSTTMTFNVFATDSESGIKKVELYIDGQFRGNMSLSGSGIYTLEVTGLDAGTHTWYVKAYNGVDLTNETPPRTFTTQIEEAKPDLSSYINITITMAIVVTIIGAAAIWKLPTKQKPT